MSKIIWHDVDRVEDITSDEFEEKYFNPHLPVVMKNFSKGWKAREKWTPEFFKSRYGDNVVKVYGEEFGTPGKGYMSKAATMRFGDYIDQVLFSDRRLRMFLYNIVKECKELRDDVEFPRLVKGFSKSFYFMFFGPKESITQLHYDIDMSHVFHTPFYGRKRFLLFPHSDAKYLYRHPFTVRSYLDPLNPDYAKYPMVAKARGYDVTFGPYDTLFIPAGWWHHVIYEDSGYALSLRCRHQSAASRLQGFYNLVAMQTVDRAMNKLFSKNWFGWKERKAEALASA